MESGDSGGRDIELRDIMRPAITVGVDSAAREAMNAMLSEGVRSLPVVGPNERLEGIITDDLLLRSATPPYIGHLDSLPSISEEADKWVHYITDAAEKPLREVMSREVCQVDIGRSEVVAVHRMLHDGVPTVVVTENGQVAGIVDRLDVYAAIVGDAPAED